MRAAVNPSRIEAFAGFFRNHADIAAFDFCSRGEGVLFPDRDSPGVLDYFFFCTAHQFGFWHLDAGTYGVPMTAAVDGVTYKGSDFLWRCATRAWRADAECFSPKRLRALSSRDWDELFADDEGKNPIPMWDEHMAITEAYAEWFREVGTSPTHIVSASNGTERTLAAFLERTRVVPGYREDPLEKKLQLLAVILENRPEQFLAVNDPESYRPIIDYHLQRSALRTGLVDVTDPALEKRLTQRRSVSTDEEAELRSATYEAVDQIVRDSGASVAAVDYFFFANRTRCPEMTVPECAVCPVRDLCAQRTELFQPVFRTTAY